MENDHCNTVKRQMLMSLNHKGRDYRIIANVMNHQGDLDITLEQKVMDTNDGQPVWIKVSPELADKNHLTVEQISKVLDEVSRFINRNFFVV